MTFTRKNTPDIIQIGQIIKNANKTHNIYRLGIVVKTYFKRTVMKNNIRCFDVYWLPQDKVVRNYTINTSRLYHPNFTFPTKRIENMKFYYEIFLKDKHHER
jgi:hypothetical protein